MVSSICQHVFKISIFLAAITRTPETPSDEAFPALDVVSYTPFLC